MLFSTRLTLFGRKDEVYRADSPSGHQKKMDPKPESRNVAKESFLLLAVADPLAAWGAVARTINWAQGAECGIAYPLTLLALISIRTLMYRFLLLVSFCSLPRR
jgi:hypothetical protein